MNPQSGHAPSSSKCSDQVTQSTGPELMFQQSRAAVPLVPVLRVEDSGEKCARPATDDSGFELSRLLLKRLEVLVAALQQVKELQRRAANAPEGLQ
jgi:hypothetical protein